MLWTIPCTSTSYRRLLWQQLHSSRWAASWWVSRVEFCDLGQFFTKQTRGGKTVLIAGDPVSGSCDCRTNSNCSGAKVSFSVSFGWIVVTTLEFIPNFAVWELEYLAKMAPHVNLEIGKNLVKFIQTKQEPWNYCCIIQPFFFSPSVGS